MGSVWKRLQRVNKRAAKFQFTASYHDLKVETTTKWYVLVFLFLCIQMPIRSNLYINNIILLCLCSVYRRPTNLSIVWTRRSRRVASVPLAWEPDMVNPLIGHISWPVPDNHTISVTLFKDSRTHELEDKDWTFLIEDVSEIFYY